MSNSSPVLGGVTVNKRFITAFLVLFAILFIYPLPRGHAVDNPLISPQDKIIAECTATIAANPNDYFSYYKRGRANLEKCLLDEAVADCSKAIEINPQYAAAYYTRGRISHERKKWDAAIDDYTQAINFESSYAQAYSNRASCYNQKEQYDLAIADATRGIELSPKLATWAYFHLGEAYTKKHQYDDAIAAYRALIANSTDPKDIERAKDRIKVLGGTV